MIRKNLSRREALKQWGVAGGVAAFVGWLPSLGWGKSNLGLELVPGRGRRPTTPQRIIWVFSPNGVVPGSFWPKNTGKDFELPEILAPLKNFQDRLLVLKGIDNQVRGDGDDHMRGMSCLLTGIELLPGNIQGGGNTPAGWPRGHSIDQEIARFLQNQPTTQTRWGALEFGVLVPPRADVWTRWVYGGPNQPIAPLSDPRQMFNKIYGDREGAKSLGSVLDAVSQDLSSIQQRISAEDRRLLDQHLQFVRESEKRLSRLSQGESIHPPEVDLNVRLHEENMPAISDLQQRLLVAAFQSDQCRIATLQYDKSVGNIRMSFIGVNEGHHELSHDTDDKTESMQKLVKINTWYAGQIAALAQKLQETPEPSGDGSLLDHTTVIWTNELGKGSSHTLNDIPFVLVGGGLGLRSGESFAFEHLPHNRLWLTLAAGIGHPISEFGNPRFCQGGVISELMV